MEKYKIHNPYYKVHELLNKLHGSYNKREQLIIINLINDNTPINPHANIIISDYKKALTILKELLIMWINTVDQDIKYYQDKFNITELLELKDLLLMVLTRFN